MSSYRTSEEISTKFTGFSYYFFKIGSHNNESDCVYKSLYYICISIEIVGAKGIKQWGTQSVLCKCFQPSVWAGLILCVPVISVALLLGEAVWHFPHCSSLMKQGCKLERVMSYSNVVFAELKICKTAEIKKKSAISELSFVAQLPDFHINCTKSS